jgi:xanthine dehydrogenase accessory factor
MNAPVWSRIRDAVAAGERVALIGVVASAGSVPRGVGARIVLRADGGFFGTIGGGALEYEALAEAGDALAHGGDPLLRAWPLGPDLGQCCGGRVTTLTEIFSPADRAIVADLATREAAGRFDTLTRVSSSGVSRELVPGPPSDPAPPPDAPALSGVFRESFGEDRTPLLLFGAGHIGRAVVLALAPLPFRIRWCDPRAQAFPAVIPGTVEPVSEPLIETELARAPEGAFILVMTHSHPLDLAIVAHALARDDLAYVGLIGSLTKRTRFTRRLREAGLSSDCLARLVCPIGLPGIDDKEPAVIAASVAAELLLKRQQQRNRQPAHSLQVLAAREADP